jgi:hypothetical protein
LEAVSKDQNIGEKAENRKLAFAGAFGEVLVVG